MAKTTDSSDVSIGTFDILAAYTYAKGLLDGLGDDEAKERGMVAAILGAKARTGPTSGESSRLRISSRPVSVRRTSVRPPISILRRHATRRGRLGRIASASGHLPQG